MLTEKELRHSVLPVPFDVGRLGILDIVAGLKSGCRGLASVSTSGEVMAQARCTTNQL